MFTSWWSIFYLLLPTSAFQLAPTVVCKPGGTGGFYTAGVCDYLKEHHDLSGCKFVGASSGSWNALLLTTTDLTAKELIRACLEGEQEAPPRFDLHYLQLCAKRYLCRPGAPTLDLHRLSVAVYFPFSGSGPELIHCDGLPLDEAIGACIASSHIPMISGPPGHRFRGRMVLDGGLALDHVLKHTPGPQCELHHTMFGFCKQKTLSPLTLGEIYELYEMGYGDARAGLSNYH